MCMCCNSHYTDYYYMLSDLLPAPGGNDVLPPTWGTADEEDWSFIRFFGEDRYDNRRLDYQ